MTKGFKIMQKIAALAREAQGALEREEDQQVAVEIKLAAECLLQGGAKDEGRRKKTAGAHHD